jgi:molybdenum cofactor cytidylyltransferase
LDRQPTARDSHRDALHDVAVVVLAAGRSSRMGANKLVALLGESSVIVYVVYTIDRAGLAPPIVVLGNEAPLVRAALARRSVTFVDAPDFAQGLSQSLRSGIEALAPGTRAAMICLGDMPFVPSRLLSAMAAMADTDRIVAPRSYGRIGNPIVWGRDFFDSLTRLTGDAGARSLLVEHDEQLSFIEWDDDGIFFDIDTPAALAAAGRRSSAKDQ